MKFGIRGILSATFDKQMTGSGQPDYGETVIRKRSNSQYAGNNISQAVAFRIDQRDFYIG